MDATQAPPDTPARLVGFVIPSNTVKRVAEALVAGEHVEQADLGVSLSGAVSTADDDAGAARDAAHLSAP